MMICGQLCLDWWIHIVQVDQGWATSVLESRYVCRILLPPVRQLAACTMTNSLVNLTRIKCYKTRSFISCCLYHRMRLKIANRVNDWADEIITSRGWSEILKPIWPSQPIPKVDSGCTACALNDTGPKDKAHASWGGSERKREEEGEVLPDEEWEFESTHSQGRQILKPGHPSQTSSRSKVRILSVLTRVLQSQLSHTLATGTGPQASPVSTGPNYPSPN